MYEKTTLENALTVLTNRMPDAHSLALGLWVKTGGRYELKTKHGISHFIEHMLFKGTHKRSCQQLKQAIEEKGGLFNGFTAEECVCYYVKILAKHAALAADVLSDMVLNPMISKNDIEKERDVIFEETRMYLDLPMQYVHDLLDELIWPNHPLGRSLLGTYDTIKNITRQDMVSLHSRFYVPHNIIAVCCGNIQHNDFVKMMEASFNGRKNKPAVRYESAARPFALAPRTRFYNKQTEQTHVCLGIRGLSRLHPDRYALALLNIILGGNMSSRLFNEVREKRSLAYEIGSSVKQYADTGLFLVHAGIDNKKVHRAIAVIMKELRKVKASGIKIRECDMAKEYYKSGLLMVLEDTMSNMMFLGEQMASIGKIVTKDEILKKIDTITVGMLSGLAGRFFKEANLRLAAIGPQKDDEIKAVEETLHL